MDHLAGILVPIACGCVLPIFAIWMGVRQSMQASKNRTQIVLAAIEKNPDMDIEELMSKISPKKKLLKEKLLKEKLLSKLLSGSICAFLGIGFLGSAIFQDYKGGMCTDNLVMLYISGAVLLGIGAAFLLNYIVGKKMLVKEMEAEQRKLLEEA